MSSVNQVLEKCIITKFCTKLKFVRNCLKFASRFSFTHSNDAVWKFQLICKIFGGTVTENWNKNVYDIVQLKKKIRTKSPQYAVGKIYLFFFYILLAFAK